MKKMILLCAAIACAGQLYGQNDINEEVARIKASESFCSISRKEFVAKIRDLNSLFPNLSREEIAQQFNTEMANDYLRINRDLIQQIKQQNPASRLRAVHSLLKLKDLADPNFTFKDGDLTIAALSLAYGIALRDIRNNNDKVSGKKIVELLFEYGARPDAPYLKTTLFEFAKEAAEEGCHVCELLKIVQDWMVYYYGPGIQ